MKHSPLAYAVWLLGRRAYSVREMTERLERHFTPEQVAQTLTQLQSQKLLDDAKLAEQFVQSRLVVRHQGRFRITQELFKRGIDRDLAKNSVLVVTDEDELESARELLMRRLKTWQELEPLKRRHRAIGLLARRGFTPSVVSRLVKELL